MAVNAEDVNIEKVALFNPLSDKMDIIVKTYPQTSYDHLYGRSRYGMMIADVACYELDDETGAYKPKIERMTGQYAGSTNLKTLIVPFARYYYQGGELVYEGGLLNASDYRLLKEGRLFFATYGTTALSQIRSAVQDGKEVLCVYGNIIYRLTMLAGSRAVFFSMNDKIAREAEVDENGWDIEEYELPSGDSEAVKYTAQVLTSARQEQARNNISAASQLLNNLANGAGLNMVLKFTTSDIENLFRLKISKKNGVTVTKDDDTEDCILMSNSYVGNSGASKVPISDVVRSFIPFKEVFFDNGSYNTCTVPIIVDNLLAATHTVVVRLCNNRGNYFPGNVQFYDPYGWFDVADNVKDLQIIFVSTAAKRTVSSGSITDNKGNINHLTSPDTLNVYVTDGTDVNDVSAPKWTCTFNNSTDFSNYVLERFYINNGTMYHVAYDSITDIMTSNASLTKFL